MKSLPITEQDRELIEAAEAIIKKHYAHGKHHVGAAIRGKSGRVYAAVHLEAYVGRVAVCAEAIALGKAVSEGERDFDTIVAVHHPRPTEIGETVQVVSPCGMCRELLSDYGSDIAVILPTAAGLQKHRVADLLPHKFVRRPNG